MPETEFPLRVTSATGTGPTAALSVSAIAYRLFRDLRRPNPSGHRISTVALPLSGSFFSILRNIPSGHVGVGHAIVHSCLVKTSLKPLSTDFSALD